MTIDVPDPTCEPLSRAPSSPRRHRHRCLRSGSGSLRRLRNLLATDAGSRSHAPRYDCLRRPSSSPVRPPRGTADSVDTLMTKADFAALPPIIQRKDRQAAVESF
ncbi:hypothetical protein GQ602_007196 [Ophiocordyceps camponoti-floridani]|uniref:Uncharacterized protein n=1 Tax=Ophiocordyceps camponoti-floridani TaxID=2030778 RepID=A0A8H4VAS0_9HYPO|nr:hypothetical protein GQ602_007196 [Ophiocordyceps camponoti-floridani]